MKARDLIAELQKVDPDTEVYFNSCCFPQTKWIKIVSSDDDLELDGLRGSYTSGDPEESPWSDNAPR